MEIIQEIGSYAGFAAVVGLAVLAALYFSQARDVRRLREWAGRSPERPGDGPPSTGQRPPARPVPRPPGQQTTSGRPLPGALPGREPPPVPRPAGPAAAGGAGPAVAAGPAAATPAGGRSAGPQEPGTSEGHPKAVSQNTMAHPQPAPSDLDEEDRDAPEPATGATAVAGAGGAAPGAVRGDEDDADDGQYYDEAYYGDDDGYDEDPSETGDRPVPTLPPLAPRSPVAPSRPGGTAGGSSILPPYEHSRPGGPPPGGRFSGRRRTIALVLTGVLALALVAFGVTQLLELGDDPQRGGEQQAGSSSGNEGSGDGGGRDPSIDPSQVTVAVLNGTTTSGLAADIGQTIEAEGYRLGEVTNGADQARAESVILFAPGARGEAQDIARRLGIGQREPIDAASQQLAGDATVVVVTGADRIQ